MPSYLCADSFSEACEIEYYHGKSKDLFPDFFVRELSKALVKCKKLEYSRANILHILQIYHLVICLKVIVLSEDTQSWTHSSPLLSRIQN